MNRIPFLVGEKVFLRTLVASDCEGPYATWFNDSTVCRGNSHHVFPYTLQNAQDFIRESTLSISRLVLAIVHLENDWHIGNISLDNINFINRSAELSIVIGEKDYWSKGCGKEASRLICDHGFLAMNLHRIACGTFENNSGMCKLAKYLGMVEEGRRRKAVFKMGRYLNVIEYGVLREEYLKKFNLTIRKQDKLS